MRLGRSYRVAFAIGVGAFALSWAGGLFHALFHRHHFPGLPPGALSDYRERLARGELRLAAEQHHMASRIDPTIHGHPAELAEAMRRTGDAEGEIEQYRLARDRWPLDPAPHRALGIVYCRYGRYGEGIACLQQSLRLGPREASTHIALGDAWLAQRRLEEAARSYTEAIRLAPTAAAAHNGLGLVYAQAGDLARAIAAFAAAARLDPDPQYAQNLERARQDQGAAAALSAQER
jgi:tetratricopeptide (TPR) repeat protein